MDRYTPFQRAIFAFLASFLLLLMIFWLVSLGEEAGFAGLLWAAAKPGLLVGAIAWAVSSISDLRYQVAALRAEVERLKSKE